MQIKWPCIIKCVFDGHAFHPENDDYFDNKLSLVVSCCTLAKKMAIYK